MEIYVPARYIKDAQTDYDAEALACLGVPLCIQPLELPPVSMGVLSVLEALDCQFIPDPLDCGADAVFTAVAVNLSGRDSRRFITDPARLVRRVRQIRRRHGRAILGGCADEIMEKCRFFF